MDPINEIPQCPAKCTLSCLSWHLGTLHKPALNASGQFCLWVIRSLSSLGSRGVNPPTHLAVQRKKRAESNSSGCTQHFEPGDFCLGSARDPKPMSFSRSSDDLGLKTSLNPSPAPPRKRVGAWRRKRRRKKRERDLYELIPSPSLGCRPPSSLLWFVEHPWLLPTSGFPICCCPAQSKWNESSPQGSPFWFPPDPRLETQVLFHCRFCCIIILNVCGITCLMPAMD